jgi:hypothetical protein
MGEIGDLEQHLMFYLGQLRVRAGFDPHCPYLSWKPYDQTTNGGPLSSTTLPSGSVT